MKQIRIISDKVMYVNKNTIYSENLKYKFKFFCFGSPQTPQILWGLFREVPKQAAYFFLSLMRTNLCLFVAALAQKSCKLYFAFVFYSESRRLLFEKNWSRKIEKSISYNAEASCLFADDIYIYFSVT